MSGLKKLSQNVLKARAKKLYFDRNAKITKIYCDEFGRFSYNKQSLLEVNKLIDVEVFEIKAAGLKVDSSVIVKDLQKDAEKAKAEKESKSK